MKIKTIFFGLLLLLIVCPTNAQDWEFVGLDSMVIYGLEVSGDTIWASTYDRSANGESGLYKSIDAGQSWVKLDSPLGNKIVTAFSIDKVNRSKIYIIKGYGTAGYFYKTTNNGLSWDSIGTPGNAPIKDFIVSQLNPNEYYVIIHTQGPGFSTVQLFYKSTDDGGTWNYECCVGYFGIVMNMDIDKQNPDVLYISEASSGSSFRRSIDRGETWQNLSGPNVARVFVDSFIPNRIYLFNYFDKIYSDDGGFSWQNMDGEYTPDAHLISFYQDLKTSVIYAWSTEGLFYSDKDSIYWKSIPGSELLPVYYSGNIRNISADNNFIYVGTANGIYKTDYVTEVTEQNNNKQLRDFYLAQNYPNPFNPSTTIKFSLPNRANIQLNVFNLLGQKVAELANGNYDAGNYSFVFNAGNLPSGVYFYQLKADNFYKVKKMQLLK